MCRLETETVRMIMKERQSWVSPMFCGLLVLNIWLQTTAAAGAVGVEDKVIVQADQVSSPCLGETCLNGNKVTKDDHAFHLVPRRYPPVPRVPRAKRQTVVVEVEEGGDRSHRVACTRGEERQTACLNGQCFAVDMGHLRSPFCQCPAMYEGPRCELLSTYYFTNYYAQLKKGAIIGGVVVGVILLIVAASIYCSYRKGRRKRDRPLCCCARGSTSSPKRETVAMVPDGDTAV